MLKQIYYNIIINTKNYLTLASYNGIMEIVIYFTCGIFLGVLITSIAHRLGSNTYEKAIRYVMAPDPTTWESATSTQDHSDGTLYDFQAPEDILNMYEGMSFDTPDEEEGGEPDNDKFKELD